MELFNIVVGIATIISTICSLISIKLLHSLNIQMKNSGNENVNNVLQNRGINNSNNITTTLTKNSEKISGGTGHE